MFKRAKPTHSQKQLGIEIEENQLVASLVEKSGEGIHVNNTAIISLPALDKNSLIEAFQKIVVQLDCRKVSCIVGISYKKVILKEQMIDATLSDQEIHAHLTQQASTLFGYASDDLYFDFSHSPYSLLKAGREKSIARLNIVATHRATLNPIIEASHYSNLHLIAIDVDVFGLARALKYFNKEYHPESIAGIFVLKSWGLLLCVSLNGEVHYTKSEVFSGELGIPHSSSTTTDSIQQIFASMLRMLQFYKSSSQQELFQQLFLLGMEDSIKPLVSLLADKIQYSTHLIKSPAFCASGLASWGLNDGD